jgi:LPS O-antigen subunit length determinant protein (WzzB/FepE family)
MANNDYETEYIEDINIFELFSVLWKAKTLIVFFVIAISYLSYLYSSQLSVKYTSRSILIESNTVSSSNNMGSYGALASIAGINMPADNNLNKIQLALISMESLDFFEKYLYSDSNFLTYLMGVKSYDPLTQKIDFKDSIDTETMLWTDNSKPSLDDSYSEYLSAYFISRNNEKNTYTFSFKNISPYISEFLLSKMIITVNSSIHDYEKTANQQSLKYLQNQLLLANGQELKEAIARLIEDNIKKGMMMESSEDYVFSIIDKPRKGIKTEPSRSLYVLVGALLSSILSCITVLSLYFNSKIITLTVYPPRINIKSI